MDTDWLFLLNGFGSLVSDRQIKGSQQPEGGGFKALHFQLSTNFYRSTKLGLTT